MMVTNLRGSYEEKLAVLGLRTLQDRRVRGDLIETYKILTGKSDVDPATWFILAKEMDGNVSTRAASGYLNLVPPPVPKTDLRRYFYSHRVVPLWNQLPDHLKNVKTTNQFKIALDRHNGYQ